MIRPKSSRPKSELPAMPLASCLAKTCWTSSGPTPGRSVEEHCRIAGAVADNLLGRLFSVWPAGASVFPENSMLAPLLHDIGKVSPKFQKMLYDNIPGIEPWPQLASTDARSHDSGERHEAVSFATLRANGASENLAWCAGLHHGHNFLPRPDTSEIYGGSSWAGARRDLLDKLKGSQEFPVVDTLPGQLLLAGLTVVSDWIASGDIFSEPGQDWRGLIDAALDDAGFFYQKPVQGLTFREIFGFSPNACQELAGENISRPGIYILEAPMGSGKTEAALYAAYRLLAQGHASGIYFGLPTQLTSNKIHERVDHFLARILPGQPGAILAHGEAWLARYQRQLMGEELQPGGQWFEQGRRAILAPYAVGTVDQALLAALRARWSGLRLFGLAGKVVILDEIHSYDAYTSAIVDRLISHLTALGSTVIILSATLARSRRVALLKAAGASPAAQEASYPRLTVTWGEQAARPVAMPSGQGANVSVKLIDEDERAIDEILERAASGQQTVWIENTIRSAQMIFRKLGARAAQYGIETGLLHSRFTASDRSLNEAYWTEILGKAGKYKGQSRDDCGRILVGTQVIEQSLDIDADFMVSRFAPTDLVLQRLGRLWRHERVGRPSGATRQICLLAPALEDVLRSPRDAFAESGTSAVYSPYTLARSLEAWQDRKKIRLPDDIEMLIERTHSSRQEESDSPMSREQAREIAEVGRKIACASLNSSTLGKIIDEDSASARLVETESVKILLLRDMDIDAGICQTLAGETIELSANCRGMARRDAAASLAAQIVKAPVQYAPPPAAGGCQQILKPFFYEAKSGALRVLLIDRACKARDVNGLSYDSIHYDRRTGYEYVQA